MKITIDIPDKFINDYTADKFKDFFSRVAADIDNDGLCGNYEKETAEMFLKAFEESGRETNADKIRNMSNEELADFLCKVKSDYQWMEHEFPSEEEHGEWEEWLQSEAE